MKVTAITTTATTLVTGRWRGRPSWLSIQIGRVFCWPAVKVVTMSSSKRQGEGEHAAGQQRGGELRQDHVAEGLEAVGAEVHGGLEQASGRRRRRATTLL